MSSSSDSSANNFVRRKTTLTRAQREQLRIEQQINKLSIKFNRATKLPNEHLAIGELETIKIGFPGPDCNCSTSNTKVHSKSVYICQDCHTAHRVICPLSQFDSTQELEDAVYSFIHLRCYFCFRDRHINDPHTRTPAHILAMSALQE